MASLVRQIFDAMPLSAVRRELATDGDAWDERSEAELACYVSVYGAGFMPGAYPGRAVSEKAKKDARTTGRNGDIPIWAFRPTSLSKVEDVSCKVLEDDFREYLVLRSCEWGIREPGTSGFRDEVVVEYNGGRVYLPLTPEFLLCSARLHPPDDTLSVGEKDGELFPLKAYYETSIVVAFVYDVPYEAVPNEDPNAPALEASQKPQRKPKPLRETDPEGWAEIQRNIETFGGVAATGKSAASADGSSSDSAQTRAIRHGLLKDDLWDPVDEAMFSETDQPGTDVHFVPQRVLVLLVVTPCAEHDDYQPELPNGGLAGTARFFPHAMIKATFPSDRMEAGVRMIRPSQTTIIDGKTCGCREMKQEMRSLLVRDKNQGDLVVNPGAPPFWNAIFSDYRTEPVARSGGNPREGASSPLLMVNPDRKAGVYTTGTLLARQGAFDNIHLAPRMTFPSEIEGVSHVPSPLNVPMALANARTFKLGELEIHPDATVDWTEVTMAPFCAHDCFHVHWRWSDHMATKGVFGWSESEPYKVPGAPMVPQHHKITVWLDADTTIVVYEEAEYAGERKIASDAWEVFNYQGAGYVVSARTATMTAVKLFVQSQSEYVFRTKDGKSLSPSESWSVFYFTLRYEIDFSFLDAPKIFERVKRPK